VRTIRIGGTDGQAHIDFQPCGGTHVANTPEIGAVGVSKIEKKGKVLMLNIWGTWCGPCRQEMPHLIEMQAKYKDQGFEVIGLNIGTYEGTPESTEDIQKFATEMKLNYTLARSPRQATGAFYAITKQQVVPQTMLVDREGRVRGIFVGGGQRIFDSMKENLAKVMAE